ncbi:MAG: VWA domain-containing protein [Polyangiaceae bacterium]|nr:VWA domain-containing protein [Polyangiaceae bacterium]
MAALRAWALVVFGLSTACGATPPEEETAGWDPEIATGGGGGSGGALASGGSGGSGGMSLGPGCTGACTPGTFCSASGSCIADGTCAADGDCGGGKVCDPNTLTCTVGGKCGQKPFKLVAQTPNLMIVLDRSGSMGKSVPGSNKSRWQVASEALAQVFKKYDGKIDFGLSLFSACLSQGCAPGIIDAPLPTPVATLQAKIAATKLCNSGHNETVIGGTLQALVGHPALQAPGKENVVVLITDGADNCGGGGANAATALKNQPVPVKTYVVGFSGDVNKSELSKIATAAGTGPYYQAENAAQLDASLSAITQDVATCSYKLDEVPPSSGVWVFFNKDPKGVPQDGTNGWSYDAPTQSVVFHGSSCALIKQGAVTAIDVIYACEKPDLG